MAHNVNVRRLATECLYDVIENHCRADARIDAAARYLSAADRRWLHEAVYGVLRRYCSLTGDVCRFLGKKPHALPFLALLLGVYQLRYMRLPAHAAIHETVQAVKESPHAYAAAMVNAVLRRCQAAGPPARLTPQQRCELPPWLYRRWCAAFGGKQVAAFMAHCVSPPPLCLAILRGGREQWLETAVAKGTGARPGMLSDRAVLLPATTDVASLPGYREGVFVVMDQAAQLAAAPLQGTKGIVLDACAAPGGKAALIAAAMPQGILLAVDLNKARMGLLRQNIARLGCRRMRPLQADAAVLPLADGSVDAVLVDAPCSASGLLRRHPDAKFLHDPGDIARHAALQRRLLAEALRVTRPGGRVVYAVCSLHPQEGEAVVAAVQHAVKPAPLPEALQPFAVGEGMARLFPGAENDGFFIACLRKV